LFSLMSGVYVYILRSIQHIGINDVKNTNEPNMPNAVA